LPDRIFVGDLLNDIHLTNAKKQAARKATSLSKETKS
jgi:hypothetical protein